MSIRSRRGFSLLELMVGIAIVGVLASLSAVGFRGYQDKARKAHVISAMKGIVDELKAYGADMGEYPDSLAQLGLDGLKDPWGNPYGYTNLATASRGQARKDRFLVPINSDFDLFSKGPDGRSVSPLTAKHSRDDIVRANDGAFYGWARDY
jgi:general secretion pathway protein G